MGVSELETRLLSRETGAEEIPRPLRNEAEYGRSEFHFPAACQRDDHPKLDAGDAGAFSFRSQGAPGNHAHQTAEGDAGFCASISRHNRTAGRSRQAWARTVSATSQSEGRCGTAQGL